jgi:hypothetical protein
MCVIACVIEHDKRPTEIQVRAMWDANPYGGGVAWQEDGLVHWDKGVSEDEMVKYAAKLPIPHILHFRIPSVGGDRTDLCHPFPITKTCRLDLQGKTDKHSVLFHNGTWSEWAKMSQIWIAASAGKIKAIPGPWSDSRAMAYWAAIFGEDILDGGRNSPWTIHEKIAVLGPTGEIRVYGEGWTEVDGFIVSNEGWTFRAKKAEREKEAGFMANYHTTPPNSYFKDSAKRIEFIRVETGNDRGGQKETSPAIHPFVLAREAYETAMIAYMLYQEDKDSPADRVSKNKVKELKSKFIRACRKYPEMARPYLTRESAEKPRTVGVKFNSTTDIAKTMSAWEIFEMQRKASLAEQKELSDLGQAVPLSPSVN